jgi:hypothetical protein
MSWRGITPPVGLCGEFRISSRVRAVILSASSCGSKLKARDSRRWIGTGTAPLALICDS